LLRESSFQGWRIAAEFLANIDCKVAQIAPAHIGRQLIALDVADQRGESVLLNGKKGAHTRTSTVEQPDKRPFNTALPKKR
jgi:hypothetical protein